MGPFPPAPTTHETTAFSANFASLSLNDGIPNPPPPINYASIQYGARASYNTNHIDPKRDVPLMGNGTDDSIYQQCPADVAYIITFLQPVIINTIVGRLYNADNRTYTFDLFDTSVDGQNWQELLPTGVVRSGTFVEEFPARRVKHIRIRGKNSLGPYLQFVRFQAFHVQS